VPSSFAVATGRVHWEVLLRARAIENHAYVIAAAQAGTTTEGLSSFGHSMIIGPWGEVLAESDVDGEDVLIATIDTREVDRRRSQIAVLALQRPDLYRSLPVPGGDD
jgi:predicted amidohydrolase